MINGQIKQLSDERILELWEKNHYITDFARAILSDVDLSQEQSYLLAVKVIKQQLIAWPENADSKLWNDRLNELLKNLTIEFGFDGENE